MISTMINNLSNFNPSMRMNQLPLNTREALKPFNSGQLDYKGFDRVDHMIEFLRELNTYTS